MKSKKIKVMIILILILLVLDQIGKFLINKFIIFDYVLIEKTLSITKVENEGIAFGLNKQNIQNLILSIVVIFILFRFAIRQEKNLNKFVIFCLSLIISGGISNIIDRIFRGAVFDFIKLGNLPVFNFSDMMICIGWIIYVIYLMFFAFKTI